MALSSGTYIDEVHSINHSVSSNFKTSFKLAIKRINKRNIVRNVYIVSVNREVEPLVADIISKTIKNVPVKFLKKRTFKNFKSSYKNTSNLGLDRFFNCVGGNYLYPKNNLIIIDMGTATTIDVIDKNLTHIGGLILPGALTAHNSLIQDTSMIKKKSISYSNKILGSSTLDCLSSGFFNGQYHMINGIVNEIKKNHKLRFKILITGGISGTFIDYFKEYDYHSNLILNGIINFINKN